MDVLLFTSLILIGIGTLLIIITIFAKDSYKLILKPKKYTNFAILIPARDESKVIANLLNSIHKQVDDMSNTYVIVEDLNDKTVDITKKFKANILLRMDLSKQRKGYALDEALKEIIPKKYDLYFIFDADNVLDRNYIEEMLKTFKQGYEIGVGYRNIKNSSNTISLCSGLTFSFINLLNKVKNKLKKVVVISGTGFYISGNIIEKLNGYPFHSLTEDYELSLFAKLNNISTFYNENAIYYDEQPTDLKVSIKQRTRWIKGFLESRKKQLKNDKSFKYNVGLIPYLLIIFGILLYIIGTLIKLLFTLSIKQLVNTAIYIILAILIVYILLLVLTLVVLIFDHKINAKFNTKIGALFFHPIFLVTYLNCFIKALTTKDLKWEKIDHQEKIVLKKK